MGFTTGRSNWFALALTVVAFVAGAGLSLGVRSHNTVTTRTVKVEKSWGHPSQSVDGGQVNPALAGTTCDVYPSRKTVVCHP